MTDLSPAAQTDTDPRDLIERMCACLHGWSVLWGPAANSPTSLLVDEARRYLAQSEPEPPSLKEQALEALDRMDQFPTFQDMHIIREALETLPE